MEILAITGAISASLIALISSIFVNVRHSRCTHIKCCGCECKRDVMSLQEIQAETNRNDTNLSRNNMINLL